MVLWKTELTRWTGRNQNRTIDAVLCWVWPKNTYLCYIKNMTVSFSQLIMNKMAGSEILFRLMVKCQGKNYPCLLEKNILELRNTELWDKHSAMFRLMSFGFVFKRIISEFRKRLLNLFFNLHYIFVWIKFFIFVIDHKRSVLKRRWWRTSSCSFKYWV